MDNQSSEKNNSDLNLSDLKKVHKTAQEIAKDISVDFDKKNILEKRSIVRRVWNKLIPQKKESKKEVVNAIEEGGIDQLTNVFNTSGFTRRKIDEVARIERERKSGRNTNSTILYFDANKLKQVNDGAGGHAAGNEYLQRIALAISEVARPNDSVARIGGDEFALLLPTATIADVRTLWKERLLPELIKQHVSVAVGVAEFDANDVDGSLKRADKAMYEAKKFSNIHGTNEIREDGANVF